MKAEWLSRYSDQPKSELRGSTVEVGVRKSATDAVQYSLEKNFERRSVVSFRKLVTDAVQFSVGDCSVEEIETEMKSRDNIIVTNDGVTTRQILAEEKEILAALAETRGKYEPFNLDYSSSSKDADQKAAIEALANSHDGVFVIQGRAGTGKTTLMREAVSMIEAGSGKLGVGGKVFTFAPTSEAAHKVLKKEGFENSDTVQQLLANKELQNSLSSSPLRLPPNDLG